MLERAQLFSLAYYRKKAKFNGSIRNMNYRLERMKDEKQGAVLEGTVWKGPYCYDRTKEEKRRQRFPFTEEGIEQACTWINEQYVKWQQKNGLEKEAIMESRGFGSTSDGKEATLYTMTNAKGMRVDVADYGATLVSVKVPDSQGEVRDIVLGYDQVSGYEKGGCFFGAVIGRSANRVGKATFSLNGTRHHLTPNEGNNNLHSGPDGYDSRIWEVEKEESLCITFALHSPDGDQGYPGTLDMRVTYQLTQDNELQIIYEGTSDQDTVWNPTNHSYFNLAGHDSGDVLNQRVCIHAEAFTPADAESIPTGALCSVEGTPMDFRSEKAIGRDIEQGYEPLQLGHGYDHNWALTDKGSYRLVATMKSEESGIGMEVWTDLPGMQFYSGNFVEREVGKDGAVYGKRQGVCFESQYFPNAVNTDGFDKPILKAKTTGRTRTAFRFTTR